MTFTWIRKAALIGLLLLVIMASWENTKSEGLTVGDQVPHAMVDLVESDGTQFAFKENVDFGAVLQSHKRAVIFAVPGAFTPTCSGQHLPGFVQKAAELEAKGVEAIYCVAVNDKFVMRAWGQATEGCLQATNLKLVADGNGDFTKEMHLTSDRTSGRMGIRSQRYAAIIENGVIVSLVADSSGLDKCSAESVLASIPEACKASY